MHSARYQPAFDVARALGMSGLVLSRITSTITVSVQTGETVELGLRLKFARRALHVAGYVKRVEKLKGSKTWYFSTPAIQMIRSFKTAFPDLFRGLEKDPNCDLFPLDKIFLDGAGGPVADPLTRLRAALDWIRGCETAKLALVPCGTESLPPAALQQFEKVARELENYSSSAIVVENACTGEVVLPLVLPLPSAGRNALSIGDRVVSIAASGVVPFGMKVCASATVFFSAVFPDTILSSCFGVVGVTPLVLGPRALSSQPTRNGVKYSSILRSLVEARSVSYTCTQRNQ